MYSIIVKFRVKPGSIDRWPEIVAPFTQATRAEPGSLWFEWSRSLDDPSEYVLVEAFTDDGAGPHVQSDHFAKGLDAMRPHLIETPKILSRQVDGEGWDSMGELVIE